MAASDGAHIFPPRAGDQRIIDAILAQGGPFGFGVDGDFRRALGLFLSLSDAQILALSVDDMWKLYLDNEGLVNAAEPFSLVLGLPPAPDPTFSNVTLLSGFEGTDGQTTFIDESEDARTITTQGDAQVDTAQFKFGSSSLLLDGTGDYLTLPDSADFEFDQVITVEAFVRLSEQDRLMTIASKRIGGGTQRGWDFHTNGVGTLLVGQGWTGSGGTNSFVLVGSTELQLNTQYHVALVREASGLHTLYLDGQVEDTDTPAATSAANPGQLLHIGRDETNSARDWNGHIDEFRITTGEAVYTEPFTPPIAAFPRS